MTGPRAATVPATSLEVRTPRRYRRAADLAKPPD